MDELSSRESKVARGKAARASVPDAGAVIASEDKRSRKQLVEEIAELRRQLNAKDPLDPLRRAHESELKGAKQRVQYLLSVSPAIIYTTRASGDFGCTFVSQNLRAIMGYSPEEMTTDPKCWPGHLHPEDAPRVFNEMRPLIERGGGTVEYQFRHRDGHYIWVQDTFRVVNDAAGSPSELVGAWADITGRKATETELSGTRQRLQYLLSVSPAIIYTTKARATFACTFVSENLRAIMGYSPEEMTTDPKTWPEHLHPDEVARVLEEMAP